jgi:ABC-2 type transport system ATP-binding protein
VNEGECFGFLGPNGAGKSTTIRHLMGFSKPQSGRTEIRGMDTWRNYAALQNVVGYLPGEIALPSGYDGHSVSGDDAEDAGPEGFIVPARIDGAI